MLFKFFHSAEFLKLIFEEDNLFTFFFKKKSTFLTAFLKYIQYFTRNKKKHPKKIENQCFFSRIEKKTENHWQRRKFDKYLFQKRGV